MARWELIRTALVRRRTRWTIALLGGLLAAVVAGAPLTSLPSTPSASGQSNAGRWTLATGDHHIVAVAGTRGSQPKAIPGLGTGLGAAGAVAALWIVVSSPGAGARRADRRLRWWARLVGAPPLTS